MADKIIIKNTTSEANLDNIQPADVLNGEMLLVRELDKESLYCKNSNGEISKIHRITDAGDFTVEVNVIEVQKEDTVAGDVCTWDGNSKRFFRFVDEGATDNIKNYTPIGVTIVPASHTDDGTARVMSLTEMNTAILGSNGENYIYWGGYRYDVPDLPYLTQAPYISERCDTITAQTQTLLGFVSADIPDMCSDYYTSYQNPYDTKSYYGSKSASNKAVPSPYIEDGSRNEIYHSTENTSNAYADMDGKGNTEKILAVDNGMSTDWQNTEIITNIGTTETIHPAAQCCWRYHTVGTSQGDWYLPAAGELGYLAARWKAINASIAKIRDFGASSAFVLSIGIRGWWSSTEYSPGSAVYLLFYRGYTNLGNYDKYSTNYGIYVRAFLAV